MNNFNVETFKYNSKSGDLYQDNYQVFKNDNLDDLIHKLEKVLKKQKYYNIYHYYVGSSYYIESTNKKGNMKSFRIEEDNNKDE